MLIINPLIRYLCLDVNGKINESGVWLADDLCDPYGDVSWIPAYSLEGTPNAPDGLTTPALPFPFTARELAAFAVGGLGDSLFGFYLDESGELSQERLNNMGRGAGHARKALTEAFNLYCAAEAKVIKRDNDLEQLDHQMRTKSHDARLSAMDREGVHEHHISQEEYERRHAKAMASFAHIEEESDCLKAEAHTERDAWRKAMVLELLCQKILTSDDVISFIKNLGYNEMELPKNIPFENGVKSQVRDALLNNASLIKYNYSKFKKEWRILLANGKIAYKNS